MTIAASRFFSLPSEEITPELEAAFFSDLKTGNATFKKTDAKRFAEIDRVLVREIAVSCGADTPVEVLDVGISSGTTTLELRDALAMAGIDHRITATDQSFDARIVDGPFGSRALVEPSGHFLQFEIFGRPVRSWTRRLDRFTGRFLLTAALRKLLTPAARRADGANDVRSVALVSPRLANDDRVTLREDSILEFNAELGNRFDFVRAANILNLDYFSAAQLQQGLDNVCRYLKGAGSLLLVVRTDKRTGINNGSLFRLGEDGRLTLVEQFGEGSEVAHLIPDAWFGKRAA